MGAVVKLVDFKQKRRKAWLQMHGSKLSHFLLTCISKNLQQNFEEMYYSYLDFLRDEERQTWDYENFRDLIHEFLMNHLLDSLYGELKKQSWFDSQLISKDVVLEECIHVFVVNLCFQKTHITEGLG